jgi:hypothetical protein
MPPTLVSPPTGDVAVCPPETSGPTGGYGSDPNQDGFALKYSEDGKTCVDGTGFAMNERPDGTSPTQNASRSDPRSSSARST